MGISSMYLFIPESSMEDTVLGALDPADTVYAAVEFDI